MKPTKIFQVQTNYNRSGYVKESFLKSRGQTIVALVEAVKLNLFNIVDWHIRLFTNLFLFGSLTE